MAIEPAIAARSDVIQAALSSWSVPFWATVGVLLAAVLYVRGWKDLAYLRSTLIPPWRLVCFLAGLASLWLAIASPLDAFGNFLLTAHMVQHLLMMVVAPPLILLGSPWNLLLRGLPRWAARDVLGPFLSWDFLKRFGRLVTHPAFCWLAGAVALLGWHIPAAYDRALASPGWHDFEHACLFGSSLLFWWPVVQPWPAIARWHRWTIPVYLLCGDLAASALAGVLCFSERPLYSAYATVPRLFGMSQLSDQITAGAIMWVFGSSVLLGAAVIVTLRLLDPSLAARKHPLPTWAAPSRRPPFDLLRAPVAGAFLRARYGRRALQSCLLMIAVAVIADGFFGHPMAPMNLAGVLPWTYGRAFVLVGLMAAGNFFCMGCPFTLPRELGRRLGLATRYWPRTLRTKWLAVGLLVLFFWAYEKFDFWDKPRLTAWILLGYFVAAFSVDTFFRGASFCKYVCPIGQFNFVASLVSPLEVRIRSRQACTACATHDCARGNQNQRGCELDLFLPRKAGNMDCTFCLDCVKACPHDNIGIVILAPARELAGDPVRSNLGRFSRRPDIAVLALVVVFSAFLSAAAMVASVVASRDRLITHFPAIATLPVTALFFLLALALAPAFLVAGAVRLGRTAARIRRSGRELFCRFSFALLPIGLAMWLSHVLFHLSNGWGTAWSAAQQAAGEMGIGWLGAPRWVASAPLVAPDTMLAIQMLVMDAGVLWSLYLGWRIAGDYTNRTQDLLKLLAPWAVVAALLYAAGVSVFLQPMQMRGMIHG
uniref:4Fe-4S ferredoxin, iron-sulfur binding domain protein n=1 Tax=Solibacter usitatus (strain Ellin6076) TaxID=234267 RepID=Q01PC5_SOLUE